MSNILITPIKIDGTHYCLQTSGLTVPILSGAASTTPKMPSTVSGDNVFNLYQDNPLGTPGDDDGYGSTTGRASGGIKFGVHPCAEKIDIQIVGNTGGTEISFDEGLQKYVPALSGISPVSQTLTHTFSTDVPCGHIVNITGQPGGIANNNVGYDVKITVTLPT